MGAAIVIGKYFLMNSHFPSTARGKIMSTLLLWCDVKLAVNRVATSEYRLHDCSILSQFKLYLGTSQSDSLLTIWAQLQHLLRNLLHP